MARVIVGMTTSLDGFVNDQNGGASALSSDFAGLRDSPLMREAIEQTGAVIMGRRTFDMGDPDSFVGTYEFQVPIFVVTHRPPSVAPKQDENLTFTFVTDGVRSAVAQASVAAGDKAITVVGGVDVITQLLREGLADELHIDVMPVLLGSGLRFLDTADLAKLRLEKLSVREVGERTSLAFRVTTAG